MAQFRPVDGQPGDRAPLPSPTADIEEKFNNLIIAQSEKGIQPPSILVIAIRVCLRYSCGRWV